MHLESLPSRPAARRTTLTHLHFSSSENATRPWLPHAPGHRPHRITPRSGGIAHGFAKHGNASPDLGDLRWEKELRRRDGPLPTVLNGKVGRKRGGSDETEMVGPGTAARTQRASADRATPGQESRSDRAAPAARDRDRTTRRGVRSALQTDTTALFRN